MTVDEKNVQDLNEQDQKETAEVETANQTNEIPIDGPEEETEASQEEASSEKTDDTVEDASEEETEDAAPEETAQESEEKKGFFGKKKDKKKDKQEDKIDELTDLLKRNMAEFDNFRKRTDKEKAAMYEIGAKSVIEKILPIVDNFERGFASVTEEQRQNDSFVSGMDKVYKQLVKVLEDMDVKPIPAVGEQFDCNLHNAVMHIDDENLGENVVAQEFQKGYTYKGSVVRHSMVQVAN